MSVNVNHHSSDADAPMPLAQAAKLLDTSPKSLRRGLDSGVLPPVTMRSVAYLLDLPIVDQVSVNGVDVPVLRPHPPIPDLSPDPRKFAGLDLHADEWSIRAGLDRWWTASGRDSIFAAGGFLVASGTVFCAALQLKSNKLVDNAAGQIKYDALLAGRLAPFFDVKIDRKASNDFQDLSREVLGKRVLGGGGGNFVRIA